MNLDELKTAIILACKKENFIVEDIENIIEGYRHSRLDESFIDIARIAGKSLSMSNHGERFGIGKILSKSRRVECVIGRRLISNYFFLKGYKYPAIGEKLDIDRGSVRHSIAVLKIDLLNNDKKTTRAKVKFDILVKEYELKQYKNN